MRRRAAAKMLSLVLLEERWEKVREETGVDIQVNPVTGAAIPGSSECAGTASRAISVGMSNSEGDPADENYLSPSTPYYRGDWYMVSKEWANATHFVQFWASQPGAFLTKDLLLSSQEAIRLQIGDVVAYDDEGYKVWHDEALRDRPYDHVAMIVEVRADGMLMTASRGYRPDQNCKGLCEYNADYLIPRDHIYGLHIPYLDDPQE